MSTARYNPEIHHRRSIRLKGHDYGGGGLYFVTICAHREFIGWARGHPFGAMGATCVSPVREMIADEWRRCGMIRNDVFPGEFVVMPDHVHGLIRIRKGQSELGRVIGAFKAAASRRIRRGDTPVAHTPAAPFDPPPRKFRIWHRNYYDRIVRTPEAAKKIAEYIRMNPWKLVQHATCNGQSFRMIGNPALLGREKTAMLCSRNCPAEVLASTEQRSRNAGPNGCFLSGFHSPPEKAVLNALLQSRAQLICCPAWGMDQMRIPQDWLPALEQNRMLILEMRNRNGDLAAAEDRNRFVLANADHLWTPYVTPGGMLERLLKEQERSNEKLGMARN